MGREFILALPRIDGGPERNSGETRDGAPLLRYGALLSWAWRCWACSMAYGIITPDGHWACGTGWSGHGEEPTLEEISASDWLMVSMQGC